MVLTAAKCFDMAFIHQKAAMEALKMRLKIPESAKLSKNSQKMEYFADT